MKTFEQMYSEFYGVEIDKAEQITIYTHGGAELKEFVNYCIEQAGINTVLAVSGQLLSVRAAAVKYADSKWKNRDEWLTEYNQSIADFEAGAQWLISQAASASGEVAKTVSVDLRSLWRKVLIIAAALPLMLPRV